MNSFTEENYLKIIYKLANKFEDEVSTNAISEITQTKPSSVSDMLKKLADKDLIHYKKYQGVKLTADGEKVALKVIRNHRLWEVFLVKNLGFNWDEVHEIAEELEHVNHPLLINRLDAFLNFPRFDPHGDPIPTEDGQIKPIKAMPLDSLKINEIGFMAGVKESSNTFLQYLDKIGIKIGTRCLVLDMIAFDGSVEILIDDEKKLLISKDAARNILMSL